MTKPPVETRSALFSTPLSYHENPAGKYRTQPTKPFKNMQDMGLAYSPGVAEACIKIAQDPSLASRYTMAHQCVLVITDGSAVLGLGNIGPMAAMPVMEGKSVLFQVFAGLNSYSLSLFSQDPETIIQTVATLAPSFGGINLEDIKAPQCFHIEKALQEKLSIPVFHDDQHGTAIIVCAGLLNALFLVGKSMENARLVVAGAGAGAMACLNLLEEFGLKRQNVRMFDSQGLVHQKRPQLSPEKQRYATEQEDFETLEQALEGSDIFLGLSSGGTTFPAHWIQSMAKKPIVFALANPTPEFWPSDVKAVCPDAIISTGRSDFPNQINNVLCFPYMFKGALDIGSHEINLSMKKACVQALAELAREAFVDINEAYEGEIHLFSNDYFVPKAFDPRLLARLPLAIAKAAQSSCQTSPSPLKHHPSFAKKDPLWIYQRDLLAQALRHSPIFRALCLEPFAKNLEADSTTNGLNLSLGLRLPSFEKASPLTFHRALRRLIGMITTFKQNDLGDLMLVSPTQEIEKWSHYLSQLSSIPCHIDGKPAASKEIFLSILPENLAPKNVWSLHLENPSTSETSSAWFCRLDEKERVLHVAYSGEWNEKLEKFSQKIYESYRSWHYSAPAFSLEPQALRRHSWSTEIVQALPYVESTENPWIGPFFPEKTGVLHLSQPLTSLLDQAAFSILYENLSF